MDVSLNPATKQELEAKLQELKQEIESIALKQEGMEKRGSDTCFRKLHEIAVELRREGLSLEEKKKLCAEHAKLEKDPLFAEWARLGRHQMKLLQQAFIIKRDLEKMNATEAQPSAGQPSEASSPAALGPPARPAAQSKLFCFVHCSDFIFNSEFHGAYFTSSPLTTCVCIHALQLAS